MACKLLHGQHFSLTPVHHRIKEALVFRIKQIH